MDKIDNSTIYEDAFTYDQIHSRPAGGRDLQFYLELAKGKSVLEVACGSGRLTIPIAQSGVKITGLDLSPTMLEEARKKSRAAGVQIEWIEADCTRFSLNKKFDLIFMTLNSLQHLKTAEQVLSYFACVREHLNPGGLFAFDVYRPDLSILTRDPGTRHFGMKYKAQNGEEYTLEESNRYDEINQVNMIQWFHSSSGEVRKTDRLEMRQFFPQELKLLLQMAKFEVLQWLGDWDGEPMSHENFKQIIVARP